MDNPSDPLERIDAALEEIEGLADTLWLASTSDLLDQGAQGAINWLARAITAEGEKMRDAWHELLLRERAEATETA